MKINTEIEDLIGNLEYYPPKTEQEFCSKLENIFAELESIRTYDLSSFLFKAKVLEWLIHFTLRFKQKENEKEVEINSKISHLLISLTEVFLINIQAAAFLNRDLTQLPENLPEDILMNIKKPENLHSLIEKKFTTMFSFFVQKTTVEERTAQNKLLILKNITDKAKILIAENDKTKLPAEENGTQGVTFQF